MMSAEIQNRSGQERRILLASYCFPPDPAVGGLRVARFARLLPGFGWKPYVLTVRGTGLETAQNLDHSRMAGLEGTPIVRTPEPAGPFDLYGRVKSRLRPRSRQRPTSEDATISPLDATVSGRETLAGQIKRLIVSLCVMLPDEKKNWALRAVPAAVRLVRSRRIDYVFTSGPPFSVHVIGLAVKMLTSAKWVADFRDPWVDMLPARFAHTRSRASDRIERMMEAMVMNAADRVVTTTERMRHAMVERYPTLPSGRFVCIPNGIDAERLRTADVIEKYGPLTITYAGTLYFHRSPEPLFRAVETLLREGSARPEDLRIKLVGDCRHIAGVDTRLVAGRYGLESVVEIIDRLPYAEAVRTMQRSHLLLVLAPEHHRLVVPAKVYDYLGTGSTILALADPGATADLVRETGCGRCFLESDVAGLAAYLRELLRDGAFRRLRNDPDAFSQYDARSLTGRLAAEMSAASVPVGGPVVVPR